HYLRTDGRGNGRQQREQVRVRGGDRTHGQQRGESVEDDRVVGRGAVDVHQRGGEEGVAAVADGRDHREVEEGVVAAVEGRDPAHPPGGRGDHRETAEHADRRA